MPPHRLSTTVIKALEGKALCPALRHTQSSGDS